MSLQAPIPPLRVVVVDDEALARDVLRRLIHERADLELAGEAVSGGEALRLLGERGSSVDLMFLDIEMPEMNGFELLDELGRRELVIPSTIFVTAYNRYAVRAFETQAIDYLVKPVTNERFNQAIDRTVQSHQTSSRPVLDRPRVQQLLADALVAAPSRFLVKRGKRIIPVLVEDIDWVEASGDYVRLHCGEERYLIERTLIEMEKLLGKRGFRRVHRGALVNERQIKDLLPLGSGRYSLRLASGVALTVSRTYSVAVRAGLL